jgi:uncharacterized protein (TIGR02284 family)
MEDKKSIDVLNKLIEINNDTKAMKRPQETEETELKLFCTCGRVTRNAELIDEVNQLGGDPVEGTKTSGKFFRAWMDVKSAITGKDRKAILNSCEYGEDVAVNTYKKVLENNTDDLTEDQLAMVEEHYDMIKADHDMVKSLRDSLVEAN